MLFKENSERTLALCICLLFFPEYLYVMMGQGDIEANVKISFVGFTYIKLLEYNEYSKRQGIGCNI